MAAQPFPKGTFFYDGFGDLWVATRSDGYNHERAIGCQRMIDPRTLPTYMQVNAFGKPMNYNT
jgi:hypothetical protein